MIDRAELEMTLALAEKGIRCEAPAEVMAYLCRLALAVMDAPVGLVTGFNDEGKPGAWTVSKDDLIGVYPPMRGKRVRLVPEPK